MIRTIPLKFVDAYTTHGVFESGHDGATRVPRAIGGYVKETSGGYTITGKMNTQASLTSITLPVERCPTSVSCFGSCTRSGLTGMGFVGKKRKWQYYYYTEWGVSL